MTLNSMVSMSQYIRVCRLWRNLSQRTDLCQLLSKNMSTHSKQITWKIHPNPALIDDKIHISLDGLPSNENVTLAITFDTNKNKMRWISHAQYTADNSGQLDLTSAESLGGRYRGVQPCGLFCSAYVPGATAARFHLPNLDVPHESVLSVHKGHIDETSLTSSSPMSQMSVFRNFKSKGVRRVPIREGRLRGTLFIPEGPSNQKFPGIIDLYGTTGGLLESRAALLASRGFLSLALAYFAYDDLPKPFATLDLEYFEEAINWLGKHENSLSENVGVIGMSKGGEIALFMSTISEKVRAVAAINSFSYNSTFKHSFRGLPIPCVPLDPNYIEVRNNQGYAAQAYEMSPDKDVCAIPVEASGTAEFLLIHGADDGLVLPNNGGRIVQRFVENKKSNFELHIYPGTGHIVNTPYTPTCSAQYNPTFQTDVYLGGSDPLHTHAQEDAWQKILSFFRRTLTPTSKL